MRRIWLAVVGLWMLSGAYPARGQAQYPSFPHAPIPNLSPVGVLDSVYVDALIDAWDVDITLTLSHTWTGDLFVTITDPRGRTVTLMDRPGVPASAFGCSGDHPDIIADDEGTAGSIENDCQGGSGIAYSVGGRYSPNGALSDFDYSAMRGYWTLRAADVAGAGDLGTLESWILHLEGAVIPGTQPAADEGDVVLRVLPNPVLGSGFVELTVGAPAHASIDVVDSLGRLIVALHDGWLGAGAHSFSLRVPAPGVYLARAVVEGRVIARRVAVVR